MSEADIKSILEESKTIAVVVDVFRRSEAVPEIVEEVKVGARTVWMQEGVIHEEAAACAREAGLQVVMDRCMMIEHRWHF